MLEVPFIC
ncbi:hypothetical protein CLOM_g21414, partial [Closterium sp. NIES-68]